MTPKPKSPHPTPEQRAKQIVQEAFRDGLAVPHMYPRCELTERIAQAIRDAEARAFEKCLQAVNNRALEWHIRPHMAPSKEIAAWVHDECVYIHREIRALAQATGEKKKK